VEIWQVGGDPQEGSDAATNREIVVRMGIPIEVAPTPFPRERFLERLGPDVAAIDALLGTGLAGEVRDPYRSAIQALNGSPAHIFAIDCPSGLDCNTGEILGAAVAAERTVTFGAPKKGFSLRHGQQLVGRLIVVDISIPREILEESGG
jgi:NAD(P)H-hydrate epimerase